MPISKVYSLTDDFPGLKKEFKVIPGEAESRTDFFQIWINN